MVTGGLSKDRLGRLLDTMAAAADRGGVPGLVWLVARRGEVRTGTAGTVAEGGGPVTERTIFRISSTTKPITAAAAMILLEECRLRLDDPVDAWLPELAGRRVLANPEGPLDQTLPAVRPITVRDVLTFRLGYGMDFTTPGPQPVLAAMAELGLGSGPPAPAEPPGPDEFVRRLGTLPLSHQPGERWLYHTGADVLGVLIARAAGQPFDEFLRERLLEPLGMTDTGFWVPAPDLDRFGPVYMTDPGSGARVVYDPPEGQWSRPPAFPGGGAGLVSTVHDLHAFSAMLLARGTHDGRRILARPTVEAMTSDQLDPGQHADFSGALGFGLGVGVQRRRTGLGASPGAYGWDGGFGTSWSNDPAEDLAGILLTNQAWPSAMPPAVHRDFWTCVYAAIDD